METITTITFTRDGDIHQYSTPDKAIKAFTKKGYGMWNWNITINFDDGRSSRVDLPMFNYITDHWNILHGVKPKL